MQNRIYFSFEYSTDLKSLPGFIKGGVDKVPKELSDFSQNQVFSWAEKEIKDHVEEVATRSKEVLELSARNFNTPSYIPGSGNFHCQFFSYDFSVTQSSSSPSRCVFSGMLGIDELEKFAKAQDVIDNCFTYSFEKIVYRMPEEVPDFRELIYSLDDNKKILCTTFDFTYENDFSKFQLVHLKEGNTILVDPNEIEILFKASESIPSMLNALKEVNRSIFSKNSEQEALLLVE